MPNSTPLKAVLYKTLLLILSLAAVTLLVSACSYYQKVPAPTPVDRYIIEQVTLIDVVNQKLLTNRFVTVDDGRIVQISAWDTHKLNPPSHPNLRRIDGRGKYLMPGLWDMHTVLTRLSPELDYPLFIAHGVTSIRSNLTCPHQDRVSLYPCFAQKQQWNQRVAQGQLIGPRIRGSGTFPVNGADHQHPDSPTWHGADSLEQAETLVDYYASLPESLRPFFIKNYNWVKPDAYFAMVNMAQNRGLEIGGHMPRKVGLEPSVLAGQRSFAHARLFMYECSSEAQALREGKHWDLPLAQLYQLLLDTHDPALCDQRYQLLAQHNVFLSPTLLTRRNDYLGLQGQLTSRPANKFGHYLFTLEWREEIAGLSDTPEQDAPVFDQFYQAAAATIVRAHHEGANLMVGTDANDIFVIPGASIHEEMLELNRAGIDNFDVLTAATHTPAQYFRQTDDAGSVAVGKQADLLLLNANPVENIQHTQSIHMVLQGRLIYDETTLAALKNRARARAKSHWPTVKLLFWWAQNPGGF
ncbi:amidohydrolase family protein [Gilvimarinus sp. SDUM040013]|uniref:Amidohydrolase family protein n=1 Tax=Gilvimarinus gilvus TaxID=3058038 RepID=A0ABU4S367_9GAMM|nr:amidohydrolase family protein [Gilvimarinus sp. SDUM040013]MDO3384909.1 amidohydrolase family protein [Gilvimarinus sp. SDUM040013]MDX6851450.1 amidohydrolase family protein [Gilvimarinus sp. SDUM040013]